MCMKPPTRRARDHCSRQSMGLPGASSGREDSPDNLCAFKPIPRLVIDCKTAILTLCCACSRDHHIHEQTHLDCKNSHPCAALINTMRLPPNKIMEGGMGHARRRPTSLVLVIVSPGSTPTPLYLEPLKHVQHMRKKSSRAARRAS